MNDWFEIGIIVKPQGIKGEIRVLPTTDDAGRFALLDEVYVRSKSGTTSHKLSSTRQHKGLVILKLADINNRNEAEKIVGAVLIIPPEMALPLVSDEYFVRDLIGLTVETEEGIILGEVEDVFPTGANDVYVVRDNDGKSFMIPAIKDIVLLVSIPERKMIVRLIEGLLELKR